jgi:hypothetical protein
MTFIRLTLPILLLFTALSVSARDPYSTLVAYETKQRTNAELGNSQYHLLPFRLTGTPQHFLETPTFNQ